MILRGILDGRATVHRNRAGGWFRGYASDGDDVLTQVLIGEANRVAEFECYGIGPATPTARAEPDRP